MYKTHIILGYLYICLGVEPSIKSTSASSSTLRVSRQSCRLPQQPTFGQWAFYEGTAHPGPGDLLAPPGTILELSCQDNYRLDGEESSACIRGEWKPKIGHCLRTCPTLKNTPFMTVSCTFNDKSVDNCTNAVDGTIARFTCAAFYEGPEQYPHRICSNGSWGNIPECAPVCGEKFSDPRLIVGGTIAKPGGYPWQIALYNTSDKILLCGGSLVNERVVVTAAHCVTGLTGELLSKELFIVAAGKYFRKYDHPKDFSKAQFSSIAEVYVPRQYKGDRQNYVGDIAVLVTEKTFVLSHRILPVCVDWGSTRLQNLLNSSTVHGYVTGWGFTAEYKNVSQELKVLKVPIVDEGECERRLPVSDLRLLTDDKLCAGFVNSSASACRGDSGGGLVYELHGRYYLVGVVSVSPQHQTENGGCNSQLYTLYTNVSYHTASFILDKERRFRPSAFGDLECNYDPNECAIPSPTAPTPEVITQSSVEVEDNCIVPPHPELGTWSVFGQPSDVIQPGETVGPGTSLTIQCHEDYKLQGTNMSVCFNAKWTSLGRCSKITELFCPPIRSTRNMEVTCIGKNTETKNCLNATDGTLAKFQCAPYYEDLGLQRAPIHVCQNGKWDRPTPNCVPVCGRLDVENPKNYPWKVDILSDANGQVLCGGSLLTHRIVITAASCVTDPPEIKYKIAAGKFNRTQYSRLQDILIHKEYRKGVIQSDRNRANIAILVLEDPFKFSADLQPICINFALNLETPRRGYGYIPLPPTTYVHAAQSKMMSGNYLNVATFHNSRCNKMLSKPYRVMLSSDQFCVFLIGTLKNESPVGNLEGNGMFEKIDNKYYIIGILDSFSTIDNNNENYNIDPGYGSNLVTYTTVSKYVNNFIVPQLSKYND